MTLIQIILGFVECEPVPMVRRHYTMLYYALSHTFTMCQHSSDVIESSLKHH